MHSDNYVKDKKEVIEQSLQLLFTIYGCMQIKFSK